MGPTGQLKHKAQANGYKGVSHYLAAKGQVLPRASRVKRLLGEKANQVVKTETVEGDIGR
jgi:hypothetical protein